MIDIKFKTHPYSQNNEDSIIESLLNKCNMNIEEMFVVDVGAYDGYEYSNIIKLIEQGSAGLLIEPCEYGGECEGKFSTLKTLSEKFNKVSVKKAAVIPKELSQELVDYVCDDILKMEHRCDSSINDRVEVYDINEILNEFNVPYDFDILNIDTDRFDHEIWNNLESYRPKIVIIETNSNISGQVPSIETLEDGTHFNSANKNKIPDMYGSDSGTWSRESSNWLAEKKGYVEVAYTGNVIYLRKENNYD